MGDGRDILSRRGSKATRAVSPVVGVALLVGITVVLALVVAPLVFGAVGEFGSDVPSAEFAFLYEEGERLTLTQPEDDFGTSLTEGDGMVTIQFERGETLDPANVEIRAATSGGNLLTDTDDTVYTPGDRIRDGATIALAAERGETIQIIWTADDGEESAVIGEFTVNLPEDLTRAGIPNATENCTYIANEESGGDVTVDGVTVDCDLQSAFNLNDVTVQNESAVIGTVAGDGTVEITNSETYQGDVVAEGIAPVRINSGSTVSGDVEAQDGEVEVSGSEVDGAVTAVNDVAVTDGTVQGNITTGGLVPGNVALQESSVGGNIDADGAVSVDTSVVDGNLVADGDVDITDSVIAGDVVSGGKVECESSTVNGQSCDEYFDG